MFDRNEVGAPAGQRPVRVLHLVPSMSAGGIESLVLSLWESIDRTRVAFDIAALNSTEQLHTSRFEALGSEVSFISEAGVRTDFISKVAWRIRAVPAFAEVLRRKHYDAVHIHTFRIHTPFSAVAAFRGVPVRIVHAHESGKKHEGIWSLLSRGARGLFGLDHFVTHKIGCSDAATQWFWGDRALARGDAFTIYNGIEVERFLGSGQSTAINPRIVRGVRFIHIGRYAEQKNQEFLLEVFAAIRKVRSDAFLDIVGFGPLEDRLRAKARNLGLANSIAFHERSVDVPTLLARSDFFLLPSLHEGFGIVAVEAQVAGVAVFVSDSITREIDMGMAEFIPLDIGAEGWAQRIIRSIEEGRFPKECSVEQLHRFDIKEIAKQWTKLYETGDAGAAVAIAQER